METGKTNEKGIYTSSPLEVADYEVSVIKAGYKEQNYKIQVREAYNKHIYVTLSVEKVKN